MGQKQSNPYSYFDFIPVLVATTYASRAGSDFEAWKRGFVIGAGLGLLHLGWHLWKKQKMDSFALGMNVFLLFGTLSFQFQIQPLLFAFDKMREAISFVFLGLTGLALILAQKEGLLTNEGPRSRMYSLILMGLIGLAGAISYQFKGDQLLSVSLPFMGLFLARSYLNKMNLGPNPAR